MLVDSAYGKSHIRLVQVRRRGTQHSLTDLTVGVRFEGDYGPSYSDGDNRDVLPTDTMKNTVYAFAGRGPIGEPERFGLALCRHFLEGNPSLITVRIDLTDHAWHPVAIGGRDHGHAFMQRGPDTRTATIQCTRDRDMVGAGIADLVIIKTAQSAFTDFRRDAFTTLAETTDRLLATSLTATWHYAEDDLPFDTLYASVRQTLLAAFAEHDSRSVQHTLHAMGAAVLDAIDAVTAIRLVMPNRHHLPVDLTPFGLVNRNEVFVATAEPYGLIEATLAR